MKKITLLNIALVATIIGQAQNVGIGETNPTAGKLITAPSSVAFNSLKLANNISFVLQVNGHLVAD